MEKLNLELGQLVHFTVDSLAKAWIQLIEKLGKFVVWILDLKLDGRLQFSLDLIV